MVCVGYSLASGQPCARPAARRVVLGCRHEHVAARELCDWHLDDVARGMHRCGDCHAAGCGCVLVAVPGPR